MGRLEDIIDRNRNPRKHRKTRFPVGIMLSAFVLLVLILMIFTDLGMTPSKQATPAAPGAHERQHSGEKHVDGVLLYGGPRRAKDAGSPDAR